MDVAIRHDYGSEFQSHAEFLELNRDRGEALPGLYEGEGKFSAGQKARFFSVDGNQIWLGQNLQQVLLLERLDYRANRNIGSADEYIEKVADIHRRRRGRRGGRRRPAVGGRSGGCVMNSHAPELTGLRGSQRVSLTKIE